MPNSSPLLSQAVSQSKLFDGLLWIGVIVGTAFAAAFVILWIRRRFRWDSPPAEWAFSLEELRQMRDRGDLTVAEYEALRRHAMERVPQTMSRK